MKKIIFLILVCVSIMLSGCSKAGSGATVTGKVTVDGQKLEKGTVSIFPMEGNPGTPRGGVIKNGNFSVANVNPGKVKLIVTVDQEGPSGSTDDAMKFQAKPIQLADNEKEFTVEPKENQIDMKITLKK